MKNILAENMRRFGTKNLHESIDVQAIIDRAVEEYKKTGNKCISKQKCPNLFRLSEGNVFAINAIIFSLLPLTEYAMMSPFFKKLQWTPITLDVTKYAWKVTYDKYSEAKKELILSEIQSLAKCLGEEYLKRVIFGPLGDYF